MTKLDRKALRDYYEMIAWKDGGFGYGEIAKMMGVSESYLISLENYFG